MSGTRLRALTASVVAAVVLSLAPVAAYAADDPDPVTVTGGVATLPAPPESPQTLSSGALQAAADAVQQNGARRLPLQDGADVGAGVLRVEVAYADEAAARAAVAAVGGSGIQPVSGHLLTADVPVGQLAALEADPAIAHLQLPVDRTAPVASPGPAALPGVPSLLSPSVPTAGARGSDILTQVRASSWHSRGYRGTGVSVGIIDYFNSSVWNSSRASGDVPAYSGTFCRTGGQTCSLFTVPQPTGNHGVAVAEAIHDVAPNARLYLATVATYEDMRAAIDWFASKGVRIISRSLGSGYDGLGRGDGVYDELASYAVGKGIAWFNSAGNPGVVDEASRIGSYWRGTWTDTNADGWNEFLQEDGSTSSVAWFNGRDCGSSYFFGLRWSDTENPTDYDLYYVDSAGNLLPSGPHNLQSAGAPPIEKAATVCPDGAAGVAIRKVSEGNGSAGDTLEMMTYWYFDRVASNPYSAGLPISDSADPGVASIGAVDPVGGKRIASYSAWGPTNDERMKPDFSAGSNFTSNAYRYWGGRFNGTSAATPIAAGAAALIAQRSPSLTPARLIDHLQEVHMGERGEPGPDNVYGTGELILDQLFTTLPTPTISGTAKEWQVLTARTGTWSPTPSSFQYRWFRDATPIPGATSSTYRLTPADAGHRIRVRVTPVRLNFVSEPRVSGYTASVVPLKTFSAPRPRISGTPAAGRSVSAVLGTWSPAPTTVSYRWLRDGVAISGATSRTYTLTSADAGAQLTVSVTGKRSGYRTATVTSAPVSVAP